ncbi:MAG: hypothetical protein DRP45_04475 [Candidatus Zixiibacteriota bacterium]|nr:MAG: hypothetical protein DRP45_04475 [candidate division Zixibacteria bacterium]
MLALSSCGGSLYFPPVVEESIQQENAPPLVMEPRRFFHGMALPYPIGEYRFTPISREQSAEPKRSIKFIMSVDSVGEVVSVEAIRQEDSLYTNCYGDDLRTMQFEPGVANGRKTAMKLPVIAQIGVLGTTAELLFPVQRNRAVIETDLYWETFELNNVVLPEIKYFPSYHYKSKSRQSSNTHPFILYRLDLDEDGGVVSIESVVATCPAFAGQLQAAIGRGQYSPLVVAGMPIRSRNYLLVSFYPEVEYPTNPLKADSAADLGIFDQMRIRLFSDTVGLMAKPVPKKAWDGQVRSSNARILSETGHSTEAKIDSTGNAVAINVLPCTTRWRRGSVLTLPGAGSHGVRRILRSVSFYPALDFSGRSVPYVGLARLMAVDARTIRIWLDWLPEIVPPHETEGTTNQQVTGQP